MGSKGLESRAVKPLIKKNTGNMFTVTGANLHGQWFQNEPVLNKFRTVIHRRSWQRNKNQVTELSLPDEIRKAGDKLLLTGNDYNLFFYAVSTQIVWVINIEDENCLKKINLNTDLSVDVKRLKMEDALIKAHATNFSNVCLSAQGTVYSGIIPCRLNTSMCMGKVCDIQCGYEHYLLLTEAGRVYSWGNGRRLQLGHGNVNYIESPTLIEALAGIHIIKISAGGWHSLALSEFGDVYAWGWNNTGQLGIQEHLNPETFQNNMNSYDLPTLVDIYNDNGDIIDTNAKSIACGNRHSAILLEDNSVWTTGCNKYGQAGFDSDIVEKVLTFKKSYQGSETSSIRCGPWVTVIENHASI